MNIQLSPAPAVTGPADIDRLVSGYGDAWNESDAKRRLRRLQSIWHEDATFENAVVRIRGRRDLNAHIGAFHGDCAGWRFVVEDVATHGSHVHVTWRLLDATGRERLAGHDVGECAADRRLARVVSFWRT